MAFKSQSTDILDAVNRFTDNDLTDREVPVVQLGFSDSVGTPPTLVSARNPIPVTMSDINTIAGYIDGIESSLATITGYVDGLEGLLTGVAHDSVDSGNSLKTGSRAVATLSTATLVAAADRTDRVADLDGAVIGRNVPLGDVVSGNATNTDGTSTQCIAAQSSGIKTYLTDVTICNSSATAITVDIKDGSTVKWSFPVPAGGGVTHSFATPLAGTAATAWNFDPSTAATTITCSMSGFKSKI